MNIDDRPTTDDRPQGQFTHFVKTSNGHISATVLSDSLYVCTQTILCRRSLIYNHGDSKLIS